MVGEIVEEVSREMFVSEAVAYVQDDQADQTLQQVVRTAVLRRLEFLDANFLTALTGFIEACTARGDEQLADVLAAVREEVLRQVAGRMPGTAQVLDLALRHVEKDRRLEVLRTAMAGGKGDIPSADIDALSATASKFIDEMEDQPEVLDRRLLARLCLMREELRLLREEARYNDPSLDPEPVRGNVPQRCIAFLKELVAVQDPLRRMALLRQSFEQDWDGAAPRQKPQTAFHANQPDWVRPGRLMATLQSTVSQLQDDAERNAAVLGRLEQIRSEAMVVLDRIHGGPPADEGSAGAASAGAGAEVGAAGGEGEGEGGSGAAEGVAVGAGEVGLGASGVDRAALQAAVAAAGGGAGGGGNGLEVVSAREVIMQPDGTFVEVGEEGGEGQQGKAAA